MIDSRLLLSSLIVQKLKKRSEAGNDAQTCNLFYTLRQQNRSGNSLIPAQYLYQYLVSRFPTPEGVSKVVQVLNRLGIELDQDVSGLKSGLGRGRPVAYIGELDPVLGFTEI